MIIKRFLGCFIFLLVVLSFSFGFISPAKKAIAVESSANEVIIEVADESDFYMRKGASVRLVEGESGIRFSAHMPQAFYETMTSKDAKWYMIVAPNSGEEITVGSTNAIIFGEEENISPTKKTVEGKEVYIYSACITYDNSDFNAEELRRAYDMQLTARAYLTYTENGQDKIVYTKYSSENARSVAQVAEMVLVNDAVGDSDYFKEENAVKLAILKRYIKQTSLPQVVAGYAHYLSQGKLVNLQVDDGSYTFQIDGVNKGSVEVINGEAVCIVDGLTIGEDYKLTLTGVNNTSYVQMMKACDGVVNTGEEFKTLIMSSENPTTQKYHALGQDITVSKTGIEFISEGKTFYNIFDGNGHTITVEQIPNCGLFGENVASGAVIKNTKIVVLGLENIDNGTKASFTNTVLFTRPLDCDVRVENMYISVEPADELSLVNFAGIIGAPSNKPIVKNVYVKYNEKVKDGSAYQGGMLQSKRCAGALAGNFKAYSFGNITNFSNIYIVSPAFEYLANYQASSSVMYSANEYSDKNIYLWQDEIPSGFELSDELTWDIYTGKYKRVNELNVISYEFNIDKESLALGESANITFTINDEETVKYKIFWTDNESLLKISGNTVQRIGFGRATLRVSFFSNGNIETREIEIN